MAEPARESAAGSLSAGYFELAGLPRPTFQARATTLRGTFYPDCLWAEHRLIGECGGTRQVLGGGRPRLAREIMTRPDAVVAGVALQQGARRARAYAFAVRSIGPLAGAEVG